MVSSIVGLGKTEMSERGVVGEQRLQVECSRKERCFAIGVDLGGQGFELGKMKEIHPAAGKAGRWWIGVLPDGAVARGHVTGFYFRWRNVALSVSACSRSMLAGMRLSSHLFVPAGIRLICIRKEL
jgi:hypothetical protein